MNAVKENSYAEAPIFALGGEYLGKYGQRMRNFGVSLHGFVNWYLQEYPECTQYGCSAFYTYVNSRHTFHYPHYSCWESILKELFPQPNGRGRISLKNWIGVNISSDSRDEAKCRRAYMERILARPDRILVCPCCSVYLTRLNGG